MLTSWDDRPKMFRLVLARAPSDVNHDGLLHTRYVFEVKLNADSAIERSVRYPEVAELLGISREKLAALEGKQVWLLPWAKDEPAFINKATEIGVLDPAGYDHKLLHQPAGYTHRGKPSPAESVVQIRSAGHTWQIPARINYRNDFPEIKLCLCTPFYKRLRSRGLNRRRR